MNRIGVNRHSYQSSNTSPGTIIGQVPTSQTPGDCRGDQDKNFSKNKLLEVDDMSYYRPLSTTIDHYRLLLTTIDNFRYTSKINVCFGYEVLDYKANPVQYTNKQLSIYTGKSYKKSELWDNTSINRI